jgi:dTDP-4-amino-4,6-dideoxygalactose transaminase
MIPVTKSFIPPIEEYTAQVQRAFKNEWLTNRGELIKELEEKLKSILGIDNILITNNGTIPVKIELKLLGNNGEIITTPFSYVATTAAIVWESCTPVFVDIDPKTLTINTQLIEAAITPKTTCILATHVFGNACDIDEIDRIAKAYNIKVIYDAAHCFGVKYKGKSIFEFGDISTCSFHATKLFHTGEGGAVFCKDETLRHKIFYSHNFGHNGPVDFYGLGINGKNSELHAAMGLAIVPHIEKIISERKKIVEFYHQNIDSSKIKTMEFNKNISWNYSYYPIIFENEFDLLKILEKLNQSNIFPRRYFNPSLNTIDYANGLSMPISESVSSRIICLPLYVGLTTDELNQIVKIINS